MHSLQIPLPRETDNVIHRRRNAFFGALMTCAFQIIKMLATALWHVPSKFAIAVFPRTVRGESKDEGIVESAKLRVAN